MWQETDRGGKKIGQEQGRQVMGSLEAIRCRPDEHVDLSVRNCNGGIIEYRLFETRNRIGRKGKC